MQVFDFPPELGLISSLRLLFSFFLFVTTICWFAGYYYKASSPNDALNIYSGRKRAILWSKISTGIGLFLILYCAATWQDRFYRMALYPEGYVKLWAGNSKKTPLTLVKKDIDSIHYGVASKGGWCYVRIQLKNGESYKSTDIFDERCKLAFDALNAVFH